MHKYKNIIRTATAFLFLPLFFFSAAAAVFLAAAAAFFSAAAAFFSAFVGVGAFLDFLLGAMVTD